MVKLMLTRKIHVGTETVMSVACSNIVQYVSKEGRKFIITLLLCRNDEHALLPNRRRSDRNTLQSVIRPSSPYTPGL